MGVHGGELLMMKGIERHQRHLLSVQSLVPNGMDVPQHLHLCLSILRLQQTTLLQLPMRLIFFFLVKRVGADLLGQGLADQIRSDCFCWMATTLHHLPCEGRLREAASLYDTMQTS